jgi:alkylhydroperoxidase family enzyme
MSATHPPIQPTPPAEEHAKVEAIFQAVEGQMGLVPDAVRLYGISPPLLGAFLSGVGYFHGGIRLSAALTAMIRYLVFCASECRFCIDLNEARLVGVGLGLDRLRAAGENPALAPLPPAELTLLGLALTAVQDPTRATPEPIEEAKAAGFGEREVFDAVVLAANNKALNIVLESSRVETQGGFV